MSEASGDSPGMTVQLLTVGMHNPSEIARDGFINSQKLIELFNSGKSQNPELDLRSALEGLIKVFWLAISQRTTIAQQMHCIGKILAEDYGCSLGFKNDHYFTNCPNMLLHQDYGFSLRGFEKYKCSICNMDPVDCDHRTGRTYGSVRCQAFDGRCNICCDEIAACTHTLDEIYDDVEAIKIVADLEVVTFDMVKEPDFPFSRVVEIPYSKDFILEMLKNDPGIGDFSYGNSVIDCSHCISCKGYVPNEGIGNV
ncbi:hypothetical protein ACIPEN_03030 [Herbaspirillum chlorophenolicum]|uniref:Uncharacterized protein n=1 Tax=Herbaspirillum chlorophenolicum TaxID=211589 RepID=A0ABW8EVA8_9BURK